MYKASNSKRWPSPKNKAMPSILKSRIITMINEFEEYGINIDGRKVWIQPFGFLQSVSLLPMDLVALLYQILVCEEGGLKKKARRLTDMLLHSSSNAS